MNHPVTSNPPAAFTAAQIALVLGVTPQAVRKLMREIKPLATRIVQGNETQVWALNQLPETLRSRLAALAVQQNCRNVETLLSMPRQQWQPALPLDKIADEAVQNAHKLREVMRPWLTRQHDPKYSAAELEAQAIEDYRHVFGNPVTPRYWRELFMRTVRRDNGFEDWNRLEIYLPDRLAQKNPVTKILDLVQAEKFATIETYISACSNPHAPSKIECRAVWTLTLEKVAALVGSGQSEKSAARQVREFLTIRAPFLAASRKALWAAFQRKLEAFNLSRGDANALRDRREDNGQRFEFSEQDRDALIHRAVFYYRGDLAPAWRDLMREGFSPEIVARYAGQSGNKSHVPSAVRDSVAPEVEILTVLHQGRRAFDAIKGHVTRSYDNIASLQCMQADDFTLNTYFYVPDGQGWFDLTRGQVILFIDFRSWRILGWALEPRKSYSSLTIRSLCTHVFAEFGLPQTLYFERGIWKTATLLTGRNDPFNFTEISQGLREYNINFVHAIHPRSKTVERVGGLFQDLAEAEPGYCGRDERRDAPESLRKQMAEVAARKVHPEKYFYSLDQWNRRIGQIVEQYNAEIQQGRVLGGRSPDQAFEQFMDQTNPPTQFPAGLRYLLAHDKRLARVTLNGVTIQIGKTKFNYRGQEIAHLVGREVLAWFDPENPESIVVTNPDRRNPICVARSQSPNALESMTQPGSETLANELARVESQASHMKTRFNIVRSKFPLPQRRLLQEAQAAAAFNLGEQIAHGKSAITEGQKQTRQRTAANKDKARRLGIPTVLVGDDEQSRRALELLGESPAPLTEETES